jgi:hypothetical protein
MLKETNERFSSTATSESTLTPTPKKSFASRLFAFDSFVTPVMINKRKNQSFTFIAEMASTSTPTQKDEEPISSTPNQSTHDALKFHPRNTIRNKQIKSASKSDKKRKLKLKLKNKITSVANVEQYQQSPLYQNQQKCSKMQHSHEENYCKVNLQKKSSSRTNDRKLTLRTSQIQISINDLLYTPSKLQHFLEMEKRRTAETSSKIYYL